MNRLERLIMFGVLMLVFMIMYIGAIYTLEKKEKEQKVLIDSESESLYIKVSDKIIEYKKKGIDLDCGDIETDGDFFYVICNK